MAVRGYLGNDLPEGELSMPPGGGAGNTLLGGPSRPGMAADLAGQPQPGIYSNADNRSGPYGDNDAALETIYIKAQQYLGLSPEQIMGPGRGTVDPAVLDQLAEAYPDDADLLSAIDAVRQQSFPEPAPAPDTTNVADASGPGMRFEPDRPY